MESPENKQPHKHNIHKFLAHSYSVYFVLFLIAVTLDIVFQLRIFSNPIMMPVGFFFLFLATFIIIWAQKTGRHFSKSKEEAKIEHFCRGPYCYSRIPTQWGLFFLILGFGFIADSFFVILFTVISFFVFKFLLFHKHDKIMENKHGTAYTEYKKLLKF